MKKRILLLLILFTAQSAFSQKIVLHRNSGGDQTYYLSSVDSISFLPFTCGDEIRYEEKTYHTVLIGTQCWMKENLDVGNGVNGVVEQTDNSAIEKYCYDDDPLNCETYGGLYQWNEAMQYVTTEKAQGICPAGWHIPSLQELNILESAVGGDAKALKEIGQGNGTNTSGFSGMLEGYRIAGGAFIDLNSAGFIYSSTEGSLIESWYMYLIDTYTTVGYYNNYKVYGMSIRCLKN